MGEVILLAERRRQYRTVYFGRGELQVLLRLFSRHVECGEWLDYSIDNNERAAVFCVYRRAHDAPLYEIHKIGPNRHRQSDFLIMTGGAVLKRSGRLDSALRIFDPPLRAVP